jgi:hypothetical protein
MLILEKFRKKYHQIWITVDRENRDTKFDCRLEGEKQIVLHSTRPGPATSLVKSVLQRRPGQKSGAGRPHLLRQ